MCDMFAVIFTALLYRRGLVQLKQGKAYFYRVLQAHIPKNSIVNFRGKVFDRRIGAVHFLCIVCEATFYGFERNSVLHLYVKKRKSRWRLETLCGGNQLSLVFSWT